MKRADIHLNLEPHCCGFTQTAIMILPPRRSLSTSATRCFIRPTSASANVPVQTPVRAILLSLAYRRQHRSIDRRLLAKQAPYRRRIAVSSRTDESSRQRGIKAETRRIVPQPSSGSICESVGSKPKRIDEESKGRKRERLRQNEADPQFLP